MGAFGLAFFTGILVNIEALYHFGDDLHNEITMLSVSLVNMLFFFYFSIVYINYADSYFSFAIKLTSFNLLVLLMLGVVLNFLLSYRHEHVWDLMRSADVKQTRLALSMNDPSQIPDNVSYVVVADTSRLDTQECVHRKVVFARIALLRQQALQTLCHTRLKENKRFYRYLDKDSLDTFFVYHPFVHDGRPYEAGFLYRDYRVYVNNYVVMFATSMTLLLAILAICSPMLYQISLLGPIKMLYLSMQQVNAGNLNVVVPVQSDDEIGYLTNSFNDMICSLNVALQELTSDARRLEDVAKERSIQTENALKRVQELKAQQDGDYFLTSLLLEPLHVNKADSPHVKLGFLVQQKKQFQFRRWQKEIGGDLCMAYAIDLQDRPYTVYLNADAMGKSIQGAGGALVTGSVFDAFIVRTARSEELQRKDPVEWLQSAFWGLQCVLESFEGSMLVSVAMGVLENGTGLLHHINAEHPRTALYRNNRASFLPQDVAHHKLGLSGMNRKVSVEEFQLEAGDVLIAGSDGRDDIIVGYNASGAHELNEDENAFLENIRQGSGELAGVFDAIQQMGVLYDDISLLRIEYFS